MSTKTKHPRSQTSQLNEHVVEELRVLMTRRHINQLSIATALGVSQVWVSRRIGISRDVILTLDEVERFARVLDVPIESLFSGPGATGSQTIDRTTRQSHGDRLPPFSDFAVAA